MVRVADQKVFNIFKTHLNAETRYIFSVVIIGNRGMFQYGIYNIILQDVIHHAMEVPIDIIAKLSILIKTKLELVPETGGHITCFVER